MKKLKIVFSNLALIFCAFVCCSSFVACSSDEENFGEEISFNSEEFFLPENVTMTKTSLSEIPEGANVVTLNNLSELYELIARCQEKTIVIMSQDNKTLSIHNTGNRLANVEAMQNPEAAEDYGHHIHPTVHQDTIRMYVDITADYPYLEGTVTMHSNAISSYPRTSNYYWSQNNEGTLGWWLDSQTIAYEVRGHAYINYEIYINIPVDRNNDGCNDDYEIRILNFDYSWDDCFKGNFKVPNYDYPNI